jgi:hypothetical protein
MVSSIMVYVYVSLTFYLEMIAFTLNLYVATSALVCVFGVGEGVGVST